MEVWEEEKEKEKEKEGQSCPKSGYVDKNNKNDNLGQKQ